MTASLIDVKLEQGSEFLKVYAIVLNDEDDDPLDIAGFSGFMQARTGPGGDLLVEFDVAIDEVGRRVIVTLDGSVSEDMTWNNGVYDLVVTGATTAYRIAEGNITLSKQITELVP